MTDEQEEAAGRPVSELVERLTPREVRVAVLVAEGKSTAEIAATIGTSPGRASGLRQAIRRKLGITARQPLEAYLRNELGLAAAPPDEGAPRPAVAVPERRRQLLLRMTLDEIGALATRADRRANALVQVTGADPADDDPARQPVDPEARWLRLITDDLTGLHDRYIRAVRGGAPASADREE